MAIQQHGVVAGLAATRRDFQENQRGAALEADHVDLQAGDVLGFGPGFHQGNGLLHVAVLHPVGVEHRRLVGDADVIDQLRDDFLVPFLVDIVAELGAVHLELRIGMTDPPILRVREMPDCAP